MQTTYNLVKDALQPVYEWAKTLDFDFQANNEYANGPFDRTMNLRFDTAPVPVAVPYEHGLWSTFSQVTDDLMDLLTNGDAQNGADALLKFLDGEVKRGQRLSHFHIPHAALYREYRPTLSAYEYTLFIVIYVEYGSGQADEDEV